MRRNRKITIKGFTLIEVLVSAVLLGVGVVGLMSAATLSLRNSQRSEYKAMAMNLAREKIAEIEALGAHLWMLGRETNGSEFRHEVNYEWTITIDQLSVGELFDVKVEVVWQAPAGSGKVQLETLLNDYEAKSLDKLSLQEQNQSQNQNQNQNNRQPGR